MQDISEKPIDPFFRDYAYTLYLKCRKQVYDKLVDMDEEGAADTLRYCCEMNGIRQTILYDFVDYFIDQQLLYNLIVDIYAMDGYRFPKKLILRAKSISKTIPENIRLNSLHDNGKYIKIWRGSSLTDPASISAIRTEVSWTTNKAEAIWFANRRDGAAWEGVINRDKIIAFINDRNEYEVLQHMNVQDPHIINITRAEINEARETHNKEFEAYLDSLSCQQIQD